MTDDKRHNDDKALDTLFESARRSTPAPDAAFLDRLSADMDRQLPAGRASSGAPARTTTEIWTRFRGVFAASGLTGAAALGVWIGFVMPETLSTLALGYDVTEASGIGAFLPSADLVAAVE